MIDQFERTIDTLKSIDRLLDVYFEREMERRWKIHNERMKELESKKGGILL